MVNIVKASFLSLTILLISCHNKSIYSRTTILLNHFKNATLDTGKAWTLLEILKVYPIQEKCSDNERFDNLYVCKKWSNGDTVYVFQECEKVDKLAYDTISHFPIIIDTNNLTNQTLIKAIVFVPTNFKLPGNMKYLCVRKLSYLTEY